MTHTLDDRTGTLRELLEQQLADYTDQLTELTPATRQPGHGGHDPDTLRRLIEAARHGAADTAQALRRMSEGTYGVCERCGQAIPTDRLEIRPAARFCVPCQQSR
ncbi:TraR/DksA C4-type zinc finger protein [Micromonospora sp. WMMD1128]|uniref:TraR/DksA family transcriptional regulator n=1 Tax=unclassified Micromonospora TaxID=2617518 RepID=UPI00248AAD4E|nr:MULTISPECIES: TraR/DksA C4-type zinc finger protein [unclassified Micromonospora]WBB71272.1 TraR/DksA C4-type zinc finger protein [Micromonospora sp. WMMD1128]WFE35258.1 TraR/DksA C4-type zinc finger protein [Micromonospora sp. WMMD975]